MPVKKFNLRFHRTIFYHYFPTYRVGIDRLGQWDRYDSTLSGPMLVNNMSPHVSTRIFRLSKYHRPNAEMTELQCCMHFDDSQKRYSQKVYTSKMEQIYWITLYRTLDWIRWILPSQKFTQQPTAHELTCLSICLPIKPKFVSTTIRGVILMKAIDSAPRQLSAKVNNSP